MLFAQLFDLVLTPQGPQIKVVQGVQVLAHLAATQRRGIRISGRIEGLGDGQKTPTDVVQIN